MREDELYSNEGTLFKYPWLLCTLQCQGGQYYPGWSEPCIYYLVSKENPRMFTQPKLHRSRRSWSIRRHIWSMYVIIWETEIGILEPLPCPEMSLDLPTQRRLSSWWWFRSTRADLSRTPRTIRSGGDWLASGFPPCLDGFGGVFPNLFHLFIYFFFGTFRVGEKSR